MRPALTLSRLLSFALVAMLVAWPTIPGWSQPRDFRPLPLHEVAKAVADRYDGRLVAADTHPPRPEERDLGAALVYEFRLLSPARQLLLIRVDARSGRFLEVAGRGQIEALRKRPGIRRANGE